jgi:hypothetical protein
MTDCTLKSCARETPCRNACGAAFTLDLAGQRDGYLVIAGDPVVDALRESGLVSARAAGDDGCLIVRAIAADPVPRIYRGGSRYARAVEIGAVIAVASLQGDAA